MSAVFSETDPILEATHSREAISPDELASEACPPADVRLTGVPLRRAMRLVTIAWVFGSIFVNGTSGAPFTLFATYLGATPFQFGLLAAIPFLTQLLSLPASLLVERTGQRKSIFLWGLYTLRFMWLPIAVLPLLIVRVWGFDETAPAMALFLGLYFLMSCGQAVGGPAWTSWMADIVPERVRGKYFSRRRQWGILSGIPAAMLVGLLLDRPSVAISPMLTLYWCAGIFIVAALPGILDISLFQLVPEIPRPAQRGAQLLHSFMQPLRDRQFLWFAGFVATMTFAISFMGQFVTLYLVGMVRMSNFSTQSVTLVSPMVAQLIMLPIWGLAADRMGRKPLLAIASLGLVPVGLGWCFVGPNNLWLAYVLSAAGAALWAGFEVANLNLVLELASSDDGHARGGSAYVAVNAVIINLAGCCGGLTAGFLAQGLSHWTWTIPHLKTLTGYDVLFALSAILRLLAAVVFLPNLIEPAAKPTREALRYMTSNIYNNLFSAATQPLRLLRLARREGDVEAVVEPG